MTTCTAVPSENLVNRLTGVGLSEVDCNTAKSQAETDIHYIHIHVCEKLRVPDCQYTIMYYYYMYMYMYALSCYHVRCYYF